MNTENLTDAINGALGVMLLNKALRSGNLDIQHRVDPISREQRLVLRSRVGPGFPYFTISTLPLDTPKGPHTDAVRVA